MGLRLSYQSALVHSEFGPWIAATALGLKIVISFGPLTISKPSSFHFLSKEIQGRSGKLTSSNKVSILFV